MRIFVSYKWEDDAHNDWVEQFTRDLRACGFDALLDKWEVRYGESFSDYMTRGIHGCDAILFIMTPAFLSAAESHTGVGGAVKFEVQLAIGRHGVLQSNNYSVVKKYKESMWMRDCKTPSLFPIVIALVVGGIDNEHRYWYHVQHESR